MAEQDPKLDQALEGLDKGKRKTLSRLVTGSAFVAPIVASFAMQGISIRPAAALPTSSSNLTSDVRLKKDVTRVGEHPMGFGIYSFKYLWSDETLVGVLAQEVLESAPHAVSVGPGNFLAVDYGALGMEMTRA